MLDFGAPTGHQFVLVCSTSSVNKNSAVFTSSMYPILHPVHKKILHPVNKNSAVITSSVSEKVQRHSNNKLIQVSSTKITKAQ